VDHPKSSLPAACLLMAVSAISCPVLAQDASAPAAVGVSQGPQLPAQSQAADNGPAAFTLRLEYTGEAADNAMGGLRQGATYMNQVLVQLHGDTGQAFGWTGGSVVLEGFYENADSLDTHYVGAAQDPSIIDTSGVAMVRLYQAYYKQDIGNTNLLFGIYDLETEFGSTKPMDVFFNAAYAWNAVLDQSGLNGPSTYPNTSLAVRIHQQITDQWSVQAAVLDGVPDSVKYPNITAVNLNQNNGAMLIAEADFEPTKTTKILAGYWGYTGQFPALDRTNPDGTPSQISGSSGGYFGGATRLYSQTPRRGLDVFANIGIGTSSVQQVDRSLNIGLTYTGLLDSRPFDRLGFAIGIAHAGNPYREAQNAAGNGVETYETNFELTYRAPINRWITIQPDIQYWINPNMDPRLKNDLLFLVHFELSHVFGL
jgi:porin